MQWKHCSAKPQIYYRREKTMVYPEEFKAKVRNICLKQKQGTKIAEMVEESLETGSKDLGLYLKFAFPTVFSYQDVLEAESLEELQKKAREMEEGYKLYQEWEALSQKKV